MKPFVSLCMIVKNEEKVLERCLSSVKDVIDEIIVVDTGSTDKTKEIAAKYVNHVYHYDWNDSFADARNFAQSKATGEWILVMDADEYVDSSNLESAIQELKSFEIETFDACEVKVFNFTGNYGETIVQNHSVRIFRNLPTIGYSRSVHEQVTRTDGELRIKSLGLILYHSGYLNNVVGTKKKNERNTKLIEKQMSITGQSGFDYFNLGNELLSQGLTEKALESYIKAYQKKPDFRFSWVSFCLIQIINCLYVLKRYQDALNVIADAENIYLESPDFKCFKAIIYVAQNRSDDAIIELESLLDHTDQYQQIVTSVDFKEYRPHQMLGSIYKDKGNYEKAVFHLVKALNLNQYCYRSLLNLMEILLETSTVEEVSEFLHQNGFIKSSNDVIKFIRVFTILAETEIARKYLKELDQASDLRKSYEIKIDLIEGHAESLTYFFEKETFEDLRAMIENGVIDIYDLLLADIAYLKDKRIPVLLSNLTNEENIKELINYVVFDNVPTNTDMIKDDFLALLEKTLQMKKYDLFEMIVSKADAFKNIDLSIGHLLFRFEYQNKAKEYYEKVDPHLYDDKTFINLVKYYKEQGDFKLASEWLIVAISFGKTDYRLFENALEMHLEGNETYLWDIDQILTIGIQLYPGSPKLLYLSNKIHQGNNSQTSSEYIVGFFLETTQHYFVYESIIDELVKQGVNCHLVLNDKYGDTPETQNMFNDLLSFIGNIDRNDIEAYTITAIKDSQFQYDCMVSCYYSAWLNDVAKVHVRTPYGLLAKEYWNYSWWNVFYDKILCYSEYDASRLTIKDNCAVVGVPKFDKWFRKEIDNMDQVKQKFQLDESKETIMYAPTYGHLSSIDDWLDEIKLLEEYYNVIIKLHPGTAHRESETSRRNKIMNNFNNVTGDPRDLIPLLEIVDYVITDTSSMIFEAMITQQNILLLNPVNNPPIEENTGEHFLRSNVINLNIGENIHEYLMNKALFEEQGKRIAKELQSVYNLTDGHSGSRAAQEIITLLENRSTEPNKFLLSLRQRIFEK